VKVNKIKSEEPVNAAMNMDFFEIQKSKNLHRGNPALPAEALAQAGGFTEKHRAYPQWSSVSFSSAVALA